MNMISSVVTRTRSAIAKSIIKSIKCHSLSVGAGLVFTLLTFTHVNACNPIGGGALSTYRQQGLQLLEVSPVDGLANADVAGGTVVHADGNGLFVQYIDQKVLRINILKLNEGILSGFKFVALGVKAGDIFENYN